MMKPLAQVVAIAVIIMGTAAASVSVVNEDIPDLVIPHAPWGAGTALDGHTFYTVDIVQGTGEILQDELVFRGGTFQSVKCQVYCDFGWSPYQTWFEGDVIHFTVTTRCPDAPHTVVLHGTVTGNTVTFEGTWTTRRWYWTHQISVIGSGSTTPPVGLAVSG